MKTIYTLIIAVCTAVTVNAQSFKDQFFSAVGFSPYLDFGIAPGHVTCPAIYTGGYDTVCFTHQTSYAGFSIVYEARYNLVQPSDNFAVSIKGKPVISVSFSDDGIGGFYLPLGIGLEMGNGATYQTSANMGFTFTAGYSLNVNPLLKTGDVYDIADLYGVDLKTSWGSPFIAAGVRYWNKNNKLREINVLYGFGGSSDEIPANGSQYGFAGDDDSGSSFDGPYMVRVTWMIYLNY